MSELIVVDIGNSRMKWGRCDDSRVLDAASLSLDDADDWRRQAKEWDLQRPVSWIVAGVNPQSVAKFTTWLAERGEPVQLIGSHEKIPVPVKVEVPERVGLDRLLNAVAAASREPGPAILIDAGSAVTVDWLDEHHVFRGGAIFPGLRLMACALNDYTAKLPLVEVGDTRSPMPGTSTEAAIVAGLQAAVAGGINLLVDQLMANSQPKPKCYLTGGDAGKIAPAIKHSPELWPLMTLEGIRIAASRSP